MTRGKKSTHPVDPLGVPILPQFLDADSITPISVPGLLCVCGGEGLGIAIGFPTTDKPISRFIRWTPRGKMSYDWTAVRRSV